MNDVRRQLIVYERNGRILKWHDRMIPPGANWRDDIDARLNAAKIILLFMSPHFIESRYCYEVEGKAALERHRSGRARVIPVVLRPCAWDETPFGDLQALPSDARPISRWPDRDEACLNVAKSVMRAVDELTNANRAAPIEQPQSSSLKKSPVVHIDSGSQVYCTKCGLTAGNKSLCTGSYVHHTFVSGGLLDYCSRCGRRAGTKTLCTGQYTHHKFMTGLSADYCSRCGAHPDIGSLCTGQYVTHAFKSNDSNSVRSRCGVAPGQKTLCTGQYMHHVSCVLGIAQTQQLGYESRSQAERSP